MPKVEIKEAIKEKVANKFGPDYQGVFEESLKKLNEFQVNDVDKYIREALEYFPPSKDTPLSEEELMNQKNKRFLEIKQKVRNLEKDHV